MALDDKLYQRDLEVALALSVKELPTVTIDVEEAQDKSNFIFCSFIFITLLFLSSFSGWALTEERIKS